MFEKLSLVSLIKAIITQLKGKTAAGVYDFVPQDEPFPFIYALAAGKEPNDTKDMFCEVYKVDIHAVAEPSNDNTAIYNLINEIEEALTEDITLPEGFNLICQYSDGVDTIYEEKETKEKHAILPFHFKVAYGYKIK